MTLRTFGTDTAYPMTVEVNDNKELVPGTLTFHCAAHGNDASCPECGQAEEAAFTRATVYSGYVSEDYAKITTFGGHPLARITLHHIGRRRYTPSGGSWKPAYVTAIAPDGSAWSGCYNFDSGIITLRRLKKKSS